MRQVCCLGHLDITKHVPEILNGINTSQGNDEKTHPFNTDFNQGRLVTVP